MHISTSHWIRAFLAISDAAGDARGVVPVTIDDEIVSKFPHTTGEDVIAIAAIVDPFVRSGELRFGGHGLARRWRAVVDDLALHAESDAKTPYRENQMFWSTLLSVCVYLHANDVDVPPVATLDALIASFGPLRNGKTGPTELGPFKAFDNVKTFDDLFTAQLKYLAELHGSDVRDPDPGMPFTSMTIPRSTNGEVVLLAEYWARQLDAAKQVMGRDAVVKSWAATIAEVNTIARGGDPSLVYPKNNSFWRYLRRTAVYVALANEAPSKVDLALDALKDSITHLPENAATFVGDLAHGAGRVANEVGRGVFSGIGTSLLIGGGALAALILLTRSKRDAKAQA